jgi:hypothetical protein
MHGSTACLAAALAVLAAVAQAQEVRPSSSPPPRVISGRILTVNVDVCEVATNCPFDDTPAYINKLFGTTIFQLTQ